MSAILLTILMLLGWAYTDQYGVIHTDNCFHGAITLYEDSSYRIYDTAGVITCVETTESPTGLSDIYTVQVAYNYARDIYMITETYYASGNPFPESIWQHEFNIDPDRLWN